MLTRAMKVNTPSLTDYRVRRGEISAYGRALSSSKRLHWLMLCVGFLVCLLVLVLLVLIWPAHPIQLLVSALLLVSVGLGLLLIYRYSNKHFIEPDLAFRMWLQQVCDGDLDARIGLDRNHQHYKELNFHTRNLASSLRQLSDDMDSLVESQTRKLNDQKKVLELLFKLTADVSSEPEDEAAFVTVCQYVAEWFESARVSCFRADKNNSTLRCIATRSSADKHNELKFGQVNKPNSLGTLTYDRIPENISTVAIASAGSNVGTQLWVPFFCGERREGVLIIERNEPDNPEHSETKRVLTTVSEQLSLLCGQQFVQEQVLQARLSRDRNELAAEIHDSLAQTLLAVRYQTTLLSEKLKSSDDNSTYQDVLKIEGTIEEANEAVRGLIREYRNPLSEHRYADSLQVVIDEFSKSSGISVFFQSDDPQISFTPREESSLQRIIGEALNNTRKYAKASMIRVFLQHDSAGMRHILVEDDGVGFEHIAGPHGQAQQPKDHAEQIGLNIMRERAMSIGAKLVIDSEPGEGTRVSITMPPLIESSRESA